MNRHAKTRSRETKKKPTKLHIFDFDQTLFQSPGPGPDVPKEQRGEFWHDPSSLGEESVPSDPNENWYIQKIVDEFRKAKKDPSAQVVVMTGRSEPLRDHVEKLLEHMNLEPDELILKQKKEPTSEYKIREMQRLLKEEPTLKRVHFYEDREHHLKEFQEAAERDGYQFIPHYVDDTSADQTWEDFLEVMYEGGARKVRNTNPETKDRHPEVRADHLVKTDKNFASKLRRQFKQWVSMGQPKGRRQEKKANAPRLFKLRLDVGQDAMIQRVAARFLIACAEG